MIRILFIYNLHCHFTKNYRYIYFFFSTILQLKEIGALLPTTTIITSEQKERLYKNDDGDLTVLGELVASMPIDVTLGKVCMES